MTTDAGEAAELLNGLTSLSLVGRRLAVSLGSEDSLAAQLEDWLRIPRRPWHVDFIKGQVKAAVLMEDLEGHVDGDYASSSIQGMRDAQLAEGKKKKRPWTRRRWHRK